MTTDEQKAYNKEPPPKFISRGLLYLNNNILYISTNLQQLLSSSNGIRPLFEE